jgi:hypothetical protein
VIGDGFFLRAGGDTEALQVHCAVFLILYFNPLEVTILALGVRDEGNDADSGRLVLLNLDAKRLSGRIDPVIGRQGDCVAAGFQIFVRRVFFVALVKVVTTKTLSCSPLA